jgi:YolD-like protein
MKQRGMVKWQPFASLPEQAGYIQSLLYDLNKIEKPQLSDDQLEELNRKLNEFFQNKEWIKMSYFYDGYVYLVEGVIQKVDVINQSIMIENRGKTNRFGLLSIVDIEAA